MGLHPSDSTGKLQDGDALDDRQIRAQMSTQSLLSLPEVSSSDHIFTAKEQVRL